MLPGPPHFHAVLWVIDCVLQSACRNPDFDLVDVRFTKFQLRWEKDLPVVMDPSGRANKSDTDGFLVHSKRHTYLVADKNAQTTEEIGRSLVEDIDRSAITSEPGGDTSVMSVLSVAQDLMGWEALNETEKEAWGKALETADENDPTIFGRRLVLDIDLMVKVLVKNPNKVGVHYEASSLDIIYKVSVYSSGWSTNVTSAKLPLYCGLPSFLLCCTGVEFVCFVGLAKFFPNALLGLLNCPQKFPTRSPNVALSKSVRRPERDCVLFLDTTVLPSRLIEHLRI